jgi:hypothetical protein
MVCGEIVAGHVAWPAEIKPLRHRAEGEGNVVIDGFSGVSGDSVLF